MNETIDMIMSHRSIRKFTEQRVSQEQLETIIAAAQMASTSSTVQAYSVIRIVDQQKRKVIAGLSGNQKYIEECSEFLVWCADLHRLREAYALHGDPEEAYISTMENLIVATVDTALAAQNAATAAESLGLGIVYIGALRNNIVEVGELLELPKLVYPIFGMCIGYPDQETLVRPRLPMAAILHEDKYSDENYSAAMADYDVITKAYMASRLSSKVFSTWTEGVHTKLVKPTRMHMKEYLDRQGFN